MAEPGKNPTSAELEQLPRAAQIAFAVRCAQRVRPLIEVIWREAPSEQLDAIDQSIALAKDSAVRAARLSEIDADLARFSARVEPDATHVVHAADAALAASLATNAANSAANAAAHAANAAALFDARSAARTAARRDFELLVAMSEHDREGVATGFAIDLLGPLWYEREPSEWPEAAKEEPAGDRILTLEFEFTEGVSRKEIAEAVAAIVERADALHKAVGGRGLSLRRAGATTTAGALGGVPA